MLELSLPEVKSRTENNEEMALKNFCAIRSAIMDIKARSLLAVDKKRWADFAACFTNDATIDYSRAAPRGSGMLISAES